MKNIKESVDDSLSEGWKMIKQIRGNSIFTNAAYDRRIAYSREDLKRLIGEGFLLEDDVGVIALNILLEIL